MSQNRTFLNGVQIKKKPEGQYGPWYNMWIPNLEEFIGHLRNLPLNAKGGLNFTISEQKSDPTKMSVALDEYQSGAQAAPAPTPTRPPANFKPVPGTAKPQKTPTPAAQKSDLPF